MTSFADISHHQGVVDMAKYKAAGHDRIIMKATEGTGFTDPMFKRNWQEAGRLGLKRVAYHFQRAKFDGAKEFDHFYAVVQDAGGMKAGDWLCLDSEDTETPRRAAANAREFTARAVARGVRDGLVYPGRWYGLPNGINAAIFPAGWRKLWLSDYTAGQADSAIELWPGWSRDQVAARQFTDRATVAGVTGWCDYNRVLKDWLTVVDAVSTTDPPEDWMTTPISSENAKRIAEAVWAEPLQGEMNAPERAGQVLVHARVWAALSRDLLPGIASRAVSAQTSLGALLADDGVVNALSDDALKAISSAVSAELAKRLESNG